MRSFAAKSWGFSDMQLAHLLVRDADGVADHRKKRSIRPVYKLVDTCAAEFRAATPYYYSTYEEECEAGCRRRKR
jgi:carbamoyl-phosphate synthase large subunit